MCSVAVVSNRHSVQKHGSTSSKKNSPTSAGSHLWRTLKQKLPRNPQIHCKCKVHESYEYMSDWSNQRNMSISSVS